MQRAGTGIDHHCYSFPIADISKSSSGVGLLSEVVYISVVFISVIIKLYVSYSQKKREIYIVVARLLKLYMD